jgi:Pectate lyase superfamily protein
MMKQSLKSYGVVLLLVLAGWITAYSQSTSNVPVTAIPPSSNAALKPSPSDAIQYVSAHGNDSNDGLSLGTAKATIAAAIAALPSCVGYGNSTQPHCGTIHVGAGTFIQSATLIVGGDDVLIGAGTEATIIQASATFPTSTPVVDWGNPADTAYNDDGVRIENLTVDANNIAGSTGIYDKTTAETSELDNVKVINAVSYALHMDGAGTQHSAVKNFWGFLSTSATSTSSVIYASGSIGSNFYRITAIGAGSCTDAILVDSFPDVSFHGVHTEGCTNGIYFNGYTGIVDGATGLTGETCAVKGGGTAASITNVDANGATYSVCDTSTLVNYTQFIGSLRQTTILDSPTTTLNGTTAGSVVWSQPAFGTFKVFALLFEGYENTTATAQTITFPQGFFYPTGPAQLGSCPSGVTLAYNMITLPASMGSTFSGQCILIGQ